jgi:hypothetical protein
MTIRRDDLTAAAAAGLLQYRQIDPLLVFLLQRDICAKRQALAAQQRSSPYRSLYALLSCVVAALTVFTATLFGVLFASRAVQAMGNGAYVFFTLLYLAGGLGLAAWLRRRQFCQRVRLVSAVIMTSVPLAIVVLQQIAI